MRPTIELVLDWPRHPIFQSKRLVDNLDSLERSSRKVRASEVAVDTLAVVKVVGDVVLGVFGLEVAVLGDVLVVLLGCEVHRLVSHALG